LKSKYNSNPVFRILYTGMISQRKGINILLEAFKALNLKNAELILIGPNFDGNELLKKYEGYYTHYSFLPHEELVSEYQKADIFVLPSYLDSWAMVVLEAMACGTPVIVSENTGSKDAVQKGGGFVIPIDNVEAL